MTSLQNQSSVRSLTLGQVRFTYVVDGAMAFPPAGFFPSVPPGEWTLDLLDEHGMVPMSAGGLLVDIGERRLLIDAGLGPMRGEAGGGTVNCGSLLDTLSGLGHHPSAVDVLALTHLHPDHVGWAGAFGRHAVAAAEWKASPEMAWLAAPSLLEDGDEVVPGVSAIVTPGHSPGHTSFLITAGAERLLCFGDAFHHPLQLNHLEWGSGPDWHGDSVPAARRRLIDEMLVPGTLAFAFHFGDQPFGRVSRAADGTIAWNPVPSTVLAGPPRLLA
ncbi:MBL fold hydrolase [Actinoplanes cyaneus]|uniref:MBL fold hydrolase n=1 Tax=Actinoplanes cyaneus TaxID=52696 RepID=A0A919IVH3_9ACTN|nr:MBL fold metallo-hydrolase [Actinoplanes cyaneus]MCW2144387.1 Glyoxylase, beta-lactamase superfamily II [Actinoplanes cyaneus]GID71237.1 MBL fold hydrolase [Actinoplanes cyaneus]